MDYAGNAKKNKSEKVEPEKTKQIEKVVSSEVIVQKKSFGRKVRDIFIEADIRSVAKYVVSDVLLPAIRNTIVDASTKGIERMMYGDSAIRRRNYGGGARYSYNRPVDRGYGGSPLNRAAPPISAGPRGRYAQDDFILTSREEADIVLERMNDIIDQYEVVSVADLKALIGERSTFVDNSWGWFHLGTIPIRQIREGYLLDLPPAEPI